MKASTTISFGFMVLLAAITTFTTSVNGLPAVRRQAPQEPVPFTINSPAENATFVTGSNHAIMWVPGDNFPLSASLVPEESVSNQTDIFLVDEINGSTGAYVVHIPENIANCTRWKISLSYQKDGQTLTSYSKPFFIVTSQGSYCVPQPVAAKEVAGSEDPMSGAEASAYIDILDSNGEPIKYDHSAAFNVKAHMTNPIYALALVLTFYAFA